MKKYIVTNNLSVLYDTREAAEAAFEAEVAKLESAFVRIYDNKKNIYLNWCRTG